MKQRMTLREFVDAEMARLVEFELSAELAGVHASRAQYEWWNLMDEYFAEEDEGMTIGEQEEQPDVEFPVIMLPHYVEGVGYA